MITLLRYLVYKQKETKWKLSLWQFIDGQLTELLRNPEELEKKLLPYLAELIHNNGQNTEEGR